MVSGVEDQVLTHDGQTNETEVSTGWYLCQLAWSSRIVVCCWEEFFSDGGVTYTAVSEDMVGEGDLFRWSRKLESL